MDEREILIAYKIAREQREKAKESLKDAQLLYDKAEMMLIEFLTGKSAESTAKYDGIGYAQINKPRIYASCPKDNEHELKEYLRAHGRGDMIKEVVAPQSLSAFVGELIEAGKPPPEMVSYFLKQSVRMY